MFTWLTQIFNRQKLKKDKGMNVKILLEPHKNWQAYCTCQGLCLHKCVHLYLHKQLRGHNPWHNVYIFQIILFFIDERESFRDINLSWKRVQFTDYQPCSITRNFLLQMNTVFPGNPFFCLSFEGFTCASVYVCMSMCVFTYVRHQKRKKAFTQTSKKIYFSISQIYRRRIRQL